MEMPECSPEDMQPRFGKQMREKHFLFKNGYLHLNQGAYGGFPRPVRDALRSVQDEVEGQPDRYIRYTYPRLLKSIRTQLASMLNASVDEVVIIPNATVGVNTILRNLLPTWQPGHKVVYFSTVYGAVEKTLQYLAESAALETVEVEYSLPISDDELCARFETVLSQARGVRLAIFDTIVSMPGFRMPFERLTEICKQHGILSLVDAAHGIGHIPLDLHSFDPDFLVTNCHKWLHVPRVAAVFYVPFRNQHLMRSSLPTSHGFLPLEKHVKRTTYNPMPTTTTRNEFVAQFEYTGTIDPGPSACIPAALEFHREICDGEQRIHEYRFRLAEEGEEKVVKILGTSALKCGPRVAFANVWLPLHVNLAGESISDIQRGEGSVPLQEASIVTNWMNQQLVDEYNCYVAIMVYQNRWLARFSAEIYLEIADFVRGAEVLKELCSRVKRGEHRKSSLSLA